MSMFSGLHRLIRFFTRAPPAYFVVTAGENTYRISVASEPSFTRFEFRDFQRERYAEVQRAFEQTGDALAEIAKAVGRGQLIDVAQARDTITDAQNCLRLMQRQVDMLQSIRHRIAADANSTSDPQLRAQRVKDAEQATALCATLVQALDTYTQLMGTAERVLKPRRA